MALTEHPGCPYCHVRASDHYRSSLRGLDIHVDAAVGGKTLPVPDININSLSITHRFT
jgi:hypothetical protein